MGHRPASTTLSGMLAAAVVMGSGAVGLLWDSLPAGTPTNRTVEITARSFAFDPPVLRARVGDTLTLRFASLDVVHGFYLEGYDVDVTIEPLRREVEVRHPGGPEVELAEEVTLTLDRSGKYRYRCSKTCGAMHPFMLGELIVEPNRLLPASAGLSVGLLLAGVVLVVPGREEARDGRG